VRERPKDDSFSNRRRDAAVVIVDIGATEVIGRDGAPAPAALRRPMRSCATAFQQFGEG
jgi:hypothetical protein